MKRFFCLLLLLSLLLLLPACKKLPTLTTESEGYRQSKSGQIYVEAPLDYLAATRSKDAVAKLIDATGEHLLYDAGSDLLCNENGELYAPKGTTFPTPDNFSARVSICKEDSLRVELAASTDQSLLSDLVVAFRSSGVSIFKSDLPQGFLTARYLLLFSSEAYPNLFYRVEYLIFEKGEDPYAEWPYDTDRAAFLYDREKDFCVFAPSALYDLLSGDLS